MPSKLDDWLQRLHKVDFVNEFRGMDASGSSFLSSCLQFSQSKSCDLF
jgi:hypothetical protein